MRVSIVGTGYVGLVSGVCLASIGHNVVCVDKDVRKVEAIKKGVPPIHEKSLEALLKEHLNKGFNITTNLEQAINQSDITIIAVGTPFDGRTIDLSYIKNVSIDIGKILKNKSSFHTVVVKSTVIPGTTDNLVKETIQKHSGLSAGNEFGLGMNPEFLREGEAIQDFIEPDRIVIGGIDKNSQDIIGKLYSLFEERGVDMLYVNNSTAEMIKYTSNSFLAMLISFSNEISNICDKLDSVNALKVMEGLHLDGRVSPIVESKRIVPGSVSYLRPGCGFGGSCFPKDVKALSAFSDKLSLDSRILKSIIKVNEDQPNVIIDKLYLHYNKLDSLKIGVLGLSFKPETDDVRESPSITIIKKLLSLKSIVHAYDPEAINEASKILPKDNITFHNNVESVVLVSDVILVLTSWGQFKDLPKIIERNGRDILVIDGRGFYDPTLFKKYEGIGYNP